MGKNVVECKDLCKTFTVGDSEVHAVEKVSLKISEGEFVSVVGPSGSGKTTLLNLIGTLEKPSSGTVIIDGENTKELEIKELAEIRKEKLGFIFQFFNCQIYILNFCFNIFISIKHSFNNSIIFVLTCHKQYTSLGLKFLFM